MHIKYIFSKLKNHGEVVKVTKQFDFQCILFSEDE